MAGDTEGLLVIADLLMGAACADKKIAEQEVAVIRQLLSELTDTELPQSVEQRIREFHCGSFNLTQAVERFAQNPPISNRQLLERVALVRDADDEIDFDEDDYILHLAKLLNMPESEYKDLTLEFS